MEAAAAAVAAATTAAIAGVVVVFVLDCVALPVKVVVLLLFVLLLDAAAWVSMETVHFGKGSKHDDAYILYLPGEVEMAPGFGAAAEALVVFTLGASFEADGSCA